jgi:hypothetical protein
MIFNIGLILKQDIGHPVSLSDPGSGDPQAECQVS